MTQPLPALLCFGEALTDMIIQPDGRWLSRPGGAPWNVARILAGWGLPAAFAGAISRDCFGDTLLAASAEVGLDLRYMQPVHASPLLAMVYSTQPPQYFFVGDHSADLHFDAANLPPGWPQAARWALFGGISLARPPLAGHLLAQARQLKAAGVRIAYDPNFRVAMDARYDDMLRQMVALADVVKVSDEDLAGLFRHHDQAAALATLQQWNPQALILYTCGAAGAQLWAGAQRWQLAPPPVTVVDTVGAGDASMAGLLASLWRTPQATPAQHLAAAVASGSAACGVAGAAVPLRSAVDALCQRLLPQVAVMA